MSFGSLFAGIGGLDLGLERAGWTCKWQVENDPFCIKVLEKHWPNVQRFGDVRMLDPKKLETVDLIAGGFPCQPVSVAGKRKGTKDPRWLWPEFARIIRQIRPRFVLVENVPGILSANQGQAFAEVLGDLASLGYDAEWNMLSAASVGAPHLRKRIFIVAYTERVRCEERSTIPFQSLSDKDGNIETQDEGGQAFQQHRSRSNGTIMANSDFPRPQRHWRLHSERECSCQLSPWACCPTHENERLTRSEIRRVSHGVSSRVDRLRSLGNAVVPQVAEWVGHRIMEVAAT